MNSRALLQSGLDTLGLVVTQEQLARLLGYLELLAKWNRVYNLTAVRDTDGMVTHHLLDSLSAIPPLLRQTGGEAVRLLDVGSGGGLPGIVIAIVRPEIRVDCVDTVGKKAAFIQQVAAQLSLPNLRGLHARVETIHDAYDIVASRAFASLTDFVTWSGGALSPSGVWMAMKGKHPEAEIAALPASVSVFHVEQLTVPGLDAERGIVWMRRRSGG